MILRKALETKREKRKKEKTMLRAGKRNKDCDITTKLG